MRPGSRIGVIASIAVLSVLTTSCSTTSGEAVASDEENRFSVDFPAPVTYTFDTEADSYLFWYGDGTVELQSEPTELTVGFRIDEENRDASALVAENEQRWQERRVEPKTFQADGQPGQWSEEEHAEDSELGAGTMRFYMVAKDAVTATVSAFVPADTEPPEGWWDDVHQLAESIEFDDSKISGVGTGEQAASHVPFTFAAPEGVNGSAEAELGSQQHIKYDYDKQVVDVRLHQLPSVSAARQLYARKVRELDREDVTYVDVRHHGPTVTTVAERVDEGLWLAEGRAGHAEIEYYLLRKGDLLFYVQSDGKGEPLSLDTSNAVNSIVTTAEFG
ncbi:hypothetical protein EV191_10346 [Tamaricihabitans halophyticus]|uniref:Uncharacterized protein n=1 Tax=Tamaricihabitans halophyticus TaxID=1262583 RepID=A0A4V2SUE5_9PSEU|nr:hypothetical protein [Tamaricihabitans halophyticus]TCP54006.1 hypothetical protein EV191_10346 [Tamaricihabitans halophyticus]